MTAPKKPAREAKADRPKLHVVSVTMADGTDINSFEAQVRIARAGLALVQTLKPAPAIAVTITDRAPCPVRRQQLWALIQRVVKS